MITSTDTGRVKSIPTCAAPSFSLALYIDWLKRAYAPTMDNKNI